MWLAIQDPAFDQIIQRVSQQPGASNAFALPLYQPEPDDPAYDPTFFDLTINDSIG